VLFYSQTTRCRIGHAAVADLLWKGAVLTRLSGTVPATRMTVDLPLEWEPFSVYQDHFYTRRGAAWTSLIAGLAVLGVGLLVGALLIRCHQPLEAEGRARAWKLGAALMDTIVIGGVILYLALPKLPGADVQTSRGGRSRDETARITEYYLRCLLHADPELADLAPTELGRELEKRLSEKGLTNTAQGGPRACEDSPGNFTVRKEDGVLILTAYDMYGRAVSVRFPPPTEGAR